jgi:hypothetical protein
MEISVRELNRDLKRGSPLTTGNSSPEFQKWLDKYGLSKEKFLSAGQRYSEGFVNELYLKSKALQVYQDNIEGLVQYFNATKQRGIHLFDDLLDLTATIQQRLIRQSELAIKSGVIYDPLEDEVLQKAMVRKMELISRIDKMKLDVKKVVLEQQSMGRSGQDVMNADVSIEDLELMKNESDKQD